MAVLIGYPCFRLRITGHNFALLTLALSAIVLQVIIAARDTTGGSLGFTPNRYNDGSSIYALQFNEKTTWYFVTRGERDAGGRPTAGAGRGIGARQFRARPRRLASSPHFQLGDRRISQKEEYRVVHAHRFEPVMADELEAKVVDCLRWWPITDLCRANERLTPLSLPRILASYLQYGAPDKLPDEEVLID